jgi:hypothetical protein
VVPLPSRCREFSEGLRGQEIGRVVLIVDLPAKPAPRAVGGFDDAAAMIPGAIYEGVVRRGKPAR